MRRIFPLVISLAFIFGLTVTSKADTFFDNFNDGNSDGWVFPYNYGTTQYPGGVWSVEDGTLVQHTRTDGNNGLVENLIISDQVIEAQMTNTIGYAGVVLWYNQLNDDWGNFVGVVHHSILGMVVAEAIDGELNNYYYGGPQVYGAWYDLRVEADSSTGNLTVDLVYLGEVFSFTHVASTPYRTGLSGVYSGNEHGYFDNFRVTSDDIVPVPEPSLMVLLGISVLSLVGLRRWWKE